MSTCHVWKRAPPQAGFMDQVGFQHQFHMKGCPEGKGTCQPRAWLGIRSVRKHTVTIRGTYKGCSIQASGTAPLLPIKPSSGHRGNMASRTYVQPWGHWLQGWELAPGKPCAALLGFPSLELRPLGPGGWGGAWGCFSQKRKGGRREGLTDRERGKQAEASLAEGGSLALNPAAARGERTGGARG